MPNKDQDLHGNVPENCTVALLLIDVINDLEFEGAEALAQAALPMAQRIAALKLRAEAKGIPAIYMNRQLWPLALGLSKIGAALFRGWCARRGSRPSPTAR